MGRGREREWRTEGRSRYRTDRGSRRWRDRRKKGRSSAAAEEAAEEVVEGGGGGVAEEVLADKVEGKALFGCHEEVRSESGSWKLDVEGGSGEGWEVFIVGRRDGEEGWVPVTALRLVLAR